MCGIVGILGKDAVATQVVEALKRLEYRGYNSAGVATLEGGRLTRRRAEGKLRNLELKLSQAPLSGAIGIGHTRWATHGKPNETNAHPHATDRLAVVHNGIIENFRELKQRARRRRASASRPRPTPKSWPSSSRDEMRQGRSAVEAVAATLPRLRGAFALGFLFAGRGRSPDRGAARGAARHRLRRRRDVSRLGRPCAGAVHGRGLPISRTATGRS